jgi:hypothetical protein
VKHNRGFSKSRARIIRDALNFQIPLEAGILLSGG